MKQILILSLILLGACTKRGDRGHPGVDGSDGSDGSSCSVNQTVNGAIISCENGTMAVITNGTNGIDGLDGQDGEDGNDAPPTAYSVTELINPCAQTPGFNEVLLRLHNGQIIAHFSSGNLQFLSVIGPGTYRTTDASSCLFTIHPDMSVTW